MSSFNFENHKDKCRCCFRLFDGKDDLQIRITNTVQNRFLELTQLELKIGDDYSTVICERCYNKLRDVISLRNDFLNKQRNFYGHIDGITEGRQDPGDQDASNAKTIEIIELEDDTSSEMEFNLELEEFSFNDEASKDTLSNAGQSLAKSKVKSSNNFGQADRRVNWLFCDICGFQTIYKQGLTSHMVKHTTRKNKQRKFQCQFKGCQKRFFTRSQLLRHKKAHQDHHKCRLCDVSFSSARNVRRHIRNIHDHKRFKCVVNDCNFSTARKDYLKVHFNLKHGHLPKNAKRAYLNQIYKKKF